MRNRKGFTLIELIATIGLLGMLATILINLSIKKLNESKELARETLYNSIELAASNYVTENASELTELKNNDYIYVTLQTLVEKEYFTTSLVDPTTKESLPLTNTVYVTRDYNGNIKSTYDNEQREKVKLELNGPYNIYIKLGNSYTENGVTATLPNGEDESDFVKIDGTVNTNLVGKYLIKYIYDDRYITRNVIVYDGKSP